MTCRKCKAKKDGIFHLLDGEYVCDGCYWRIFAKDKKVEIGGGEPVKE